MATDCGASAAGFAAELKRLRDAAGLSQLKLAERVGCEAPSVSRLEAGSRRPSLPMALRLAAALSDDEATRCRLLLSAGFVPPGYVVTGLKRERRSGA